MQDVDSGQGCVRGSGEEGERGVCARMCAQLFQACLTPCDLMDYNMPGSSVHGILQARILEWVSPGDLPTPGMEPTSLMSPALAGGFFTTSATV